MHPIIGWLPILNKAKQIKSLERSERITLRQVTRIIYHWFRSVQLHFIITNVILSVRDLMWLIRLRHFYFPNLNFWWMSNSHNVGLIFSALSKSTCDGLVRPVRQIMQPCISLWPLLYFIFLTLRTHSIYQEYCHLDTDLDKCCAYWEKGAQPVMLFSRKQDNVLLMVTRV